MKENGVSEAEEVKIPESGDQKVESPKEEKAAAEQQQNGEKSAAEETPETKKGKDKTKKKKWSFRSISFSKKDKSKPSKDAEKNGEVKEVAEEVSLEF